MSPHTYTHAHHTHIHNKNRYSAYFSILWDSLSWGAYWFVPQLVSFLQTPIILYVTVKLLGSLEITDNIIFHWNPIKSCLGGGSCGNTAMFPMQSGPSLDNMCLPTFQLPLNLSELSLRGLMHSLSLLFSPVSLVIVNVMVSLWHTLVTNSGYKVSCCMTDNLIFQNFPSFCYSFTSYYFLSF